MACRPSNLEMRCPGRGRKHFSGFRSALEISIWKWDAPEGDGNGKFSDGRFLLSGFGNEMPRKGTETGSLSGCLVFFWWYLEMRCPGRGRKRFPPVSYWNIMTHLEMRCPGRGRKLSASESIVHLVQIWKWDAPEGDGNDCEKLIEICNHIWKWDAPEGDGNLQALECSVPPDDLEMRCPGRGRKQSNFPLIPFHYPDLEMRCPGRGRKPAPIHVPS